jgi:hypothetical protein
MRLTQHKTVPGKQTCDRCGKRRPPIQECSWPRSEGTRDSYWMDLCSPCSGSLEAHCEQGGTIGRFGTREARQSKPQSSQRRIREEAPCP